MLADDWDVGDRQTKAVIGERPMTLYGEYHPDQEWFPFMNGVILDNGLDWGWWSDGPAYVTIAQTKWMKERADQPAYVQSHLRQLHTLHTGMTDPKVKQDLLPFEELKVIKSEEVFRYIMHTFDQGDVALYGYKFLGLRILGDFGEMERWVRENAKGRVYISKLHWAIFQKATDWMHAKMTFSG